MSTAALTAMGAAYEVHFEKYARGRTKLIQKIPRDVWKLVYRDFLEGEKARCEADGIAFDMAALPVERTLQDTLRAALNGVRTPVSLLASKHAKTASASGAAVPVEDGSRSDAAGDNDVGVADDGASQATGTGGSDGSNSNPVSAGAGGTRKDLLRGVAKAIASIEAGLAASLESSKGLVRAVAKQNEIFASANERQSRLYEKDIEGKEGVRKRQIQALQSEETDRILKRLTLLHEQGILTAEEFKERLSAASGLL